MSAPKAKRTAVAVNQTYKDTAPVHDFQQSWEELEALYNDCARGVYETFHATAELVNTPDLIKYIENPSEFRIMVEGFKRDIDNFTNELVKIHAMHKDRHGEVTSEADLAKAFNIYGLYSQFFDNFKALTFQTILAITDSATAAINKMKQEQQNG